jgi:hypothetical protein
MEEDGLQFCTSQLDRWDATVQSNDQGRYRFCCDSIGELHSRLFNNITSPLFRYLIYSYYCYFKTGSNRSFSCRWGGVIGLFSQFDPLGIISHLARVDKVVLPFNLFRKSTRPHQRYLSS